MKNSKRILLVEDSDAHAKLTILAFENICSEYEVVHIKDGQEAIDWLIEQDAKGHDYLPKFVLLDINIPTVNGLEVLRFIKTHGIFRLIPTIILTTSSSNNDIKTSYDLNANSYIIKPLIYEDFLTLVKSLKDFWTQHNRTVDINYI